MNRERIIITRLNDTTLRVEGQDTAGVWHTTVSVSADSTAALDYWRALRPAAPTPEPAPATTTDRTAGKTRK